MPADPPVGAEDWLQPGWRTRDLQGPIAEYRARGYALVEGVVGPAGLAALRERVEALMLGRLEGGPFFFQHEAASGRYQDLALGQGWVGPSLAYRKIEKLERDPRFFAFIANPLFERIAREVVAPDGDGVSLYRAILMTKPPRGVCAGGSVTPWHQDGGQLWGLSRDPELQIWTALDDAPESAGCLAVTPGTHLDGLASPLGGVVPPGARARSAPELVPARAGDIVLLHNLAWHASGENGTDHPRRALSVCFLHAATRCTRKRRAPRVFPPVFAPLHAP